MSDADPTATPPPTALAEPVLARQNRLHLSLVWIVPIVAAVIGIVLVVRAVLATGPEITIEFRSAEGLEAGRTELRFKEVVVGHVKRVRLGPGRQTVVVTATLDKSAEGLAVDDTRFWVVRPRIGTAGVSGLSTLLSGVYIGIDAGASGESKREFVGLDNPPLLLRGEPGRSYVLQADDLGSLDVGSPVYHRRVRVGRVVGFSLEPETRALDVQIFVEAPYEKLVTQGTRFWNASGVDVALNAGGLTVNTQSVASVLAGGIAFADLPLAPPAAAPAAAAAGQRFRLHGTERAAMAPEDGEPLRVRMIFNQSMRGLDPGAPVDLLGVEIGAVRSIALQPKTTGAELPVEVVADLFPQRIGRLREGFGGGGATAPTGRADKLLLKRMVESGLRAQVRNGNLLTGRLFVALEFTPKAPPAKFDVTADMPTLPTVAGALSDVQNQVAEIVERMSKVRFDEIGADLQTALKGVGATTTSLQAALASADATIRQLTPEAQQTLAGVRQTLAELNRTLGSAQQTLGSVERNLTDANAPLQRGATQTMNEVQRAAQALRVLADYLQRHPESLLRGKPADADARAAETPR